MSYPNFSKPFLEMSLLWNASLIKDCFPASVYCNKYSIKTVWQLCQVFAFIFLEGIPFSWKKFFFKPIHFLFDLRVRTVLSRDPASFRAVLFEKSG